MRLAVFRPSTAATVPPRLAGTRTARVLARTTRPFCRYPRDAGVERGRRLRHRRGRGDQQAVARGGDVPEPVSRQIRLHRAHLRGRRCVRGDELRGRHRVARTDRRHQSSAVAQTEAHDDTERSGSGRRTQLRRRTEGVRTRRRRHPLRAGACGGRGRRRGGRQCKHQRRADRCQCTSHHRQVPESRGARNHTRGRRRRVTPRRWPRRRSPAADRRTSRVRPARGGARRGRPATASDRRAAL